ANVTSSFLGALDRVLPEITQLPEDKVLPITADPVTAGVTLRGALPKIMTLRPQLEKLTEFDIRSLDKLEDYLHAWLRAQALFLGTTLPPESFSALVDKVSTYRDNLTSDAQALVQRKILAGDALDGLKGGIAHKNIVGDVLTLTTLFRSHWQTIAGRTCVTEAELDEADSALDTLMTDLGLRDQTPAAKEATALNRQKAYTLFVNAYDQVRRAVSFLRWVEGDADEIAPSLFGGKKRKSGSDLEKPDPTTTNPTTTGATGTTGTTVDPAGTTGSTATAKPGIGLPGSDPFTVS
ncbi:MAG TPA: hypothetical protein VIV60_31610, partial [Polyangiaceae bacterium]